MMILPFSNPNLPVMVVGNLIMLDGMITDILTKMVILRLIKPYGSITYPMKKLSLSKNRLKITPLRMVKQKTMKHWLRAKILIFVAWWLLMVNALTCW